MTDNATYATLLRCFTKGKAFRHGMRVHAHLLRDGGGLCHNTFLSNLVVQMYGEWGHLAAARDVFEKTENPNTFSWNSIISAYARNGHNKPQAIVELCLQMLSLSESPTGGGGVEPDNFTFLPALSACAEIRALHVGKRLHEVIARKSLAVDIRLQTALLGMYGKCGCPEDAQSVFDSIRVPDLVSWTAMVAVYAENGCPEKALALFDNGMRLWNMKPDRAAILAVLSACTCLSHLPAARGIHEWILGHGLELDVVLLTALVNAYAKCGNLEDARAVFNGMGNSNKRDVVLWTAMITACLRNGHPDKALRLFTQMESDGITPDEFAYVAALDACANLPCLNTGKSIHKQVSITRCIRESVPINNALLNMYGKCGALNDARAVFDEMPKCDLISWNTMIAAYVRHGLGSDAICLFHQMSAEGGPPPDRGTFLSVIDACSASGNLNKCRAIHEHLLSIDSGFQSDPSLNTAIINMYGKCGSGGVKYARQVFDGMHPQQDVVSWTSMISVYARNRRAKEALELFHRMVDIEGVKPDKVAFLSSLEACSTLTNLDSGRTMHKRIVRSGFESDVAVKTALLNMYGKCGSLEEARALFSSEEHQWNLISWNSMLALCAQNGYGKEALQLFQQMELKGVKPNMVTFLCLLKACSHAGLQEEGWEFLVSMSDGYGILASQDHYVCLVDLLGRAGSLNVAEEMSKNMPVLTDIVAWTSLLGALQTRGDVD